MSIEISLTEFGLQNYSKVLAIVFEYFKIVQEEWLSDNMLNFFEETKTMHDLNFRVYTLPETEEHV